jgi:hypothetical protein
MAIPRSTGKTEPGGEADPDRREQREQDSTVPAGAQHRDIVTAPAIGAYLVLSHGNVAIAMPRNSIIRSTPIRPPAIAAITASAAGTSGYTVNELKRKGAVSAVAAQANVAAPAEPVVSRAHRHNNVDASAAMTISITTTP